MTALILNSNLDNNLYLSSSSNSILSTSSSVAANEQENNNNNNNNNNAISNLFPLLKGDDKMDVSIADTTAEEMKKSSFASLVPSNIEFVRFAIKHKSYS